jgi:TorA maturation chaperone TorD
VDEGARTAPPAAEDEARAACYALIGRLFYEAPDARLLAEIGSGEATPAEPGAQRDDLARAWEALRAACRGASPALLKQEHDALLVGVGRAPVTPYSARYAAPGAPDRHLVGLRERLQARGLSRRDQVYETEDHVSGLCDVMRLLIAGGGLAEQRAFFRDYVQPGLLPFCAAIEAAPQAAFYRTVAGFARRFIEIEAAAFALSEHEQE